MTLHKKAEDVAQQLYEAIGGYLDHLTDSDDRNEITKAFYDALVAFAEEQMLAQEREFLKTIPTYQDESRNAALDEVAGKIAQRHLYGHKATECYCPYVGDFVRALKEAK